MKKIILYTLFLLSVHFSVIAQIQIGQDIDGESQGDRSGYAVSISSDGTTVAIGAPENDANGTSAGHVRVYQNQNGNWVQLGDDFDGEAGSDDYGFSVSLNENGSILAIGAPLNNGNGANTGHVRVFKFENDNWEQIGVDIDSEIPHSFDRSGWSVSLNASGSRVAIGATNDSDNGNAAGHTRVFENQSDNWVQLGNDIDGEDSNNNSGTSVCLSTDGNTVAIGAPGNEANGFNSGHVRVFQLQNSNWVQLGSDIDGEAASDRSGSAVSLNADGTIVAVGAPFNAGDGSGSGHVRVYQFQSNDWVQLGNDIDSEGAFGTSVSLGVDGTIIAIGAPFIPNPSVGQVKIYQYQTNNWIQLGSTIDGENSGNQSGTAVSLSSDGSTLAIGAPFNNNNNGIDSGHVRVFDLSSLLSLDEEDIAPNFLLYPNPSKTIFNIQLTNDIIFEEVQLYTITGHLVLNSISSRMNIAELASGIYLVRVRTDKGVGIKKLIID